MVHQDVKSKAEEKIFGDLKVCMIEESLIIIKLDLIMIKLYYLLKYNRRCTQ